MRKSLIVFAFLAFCSFLISQQALDNNAVVKLLKAGLSDDLIVSTINASPGIYDTSSDGLIALKTAGVSDKVISAIVVKSAGVPQPAPPPPPVPAAPTTQYTDRGLTNGPTSGPKTAPVVLPVVTSDAANTPTPTPQSGQPRIFVKADPDFGVALAAALNKKRAPATVVTDEKTANYVLQSAGVAAKEESGASKIARCLFAYCAGIEGSSSVSVQLIQVRDGSVVWAYQVRKANGGPVGIQSLSEAVAKHLKNEFLDRQKYPAGN